MTRERGTDRAAERTPLPRCNGKRFAIVAARFYRELSERMIASARRALHDCGVDDEDVQVYDVPGCFELPLAAQKIVTEGAYDGVVALGAVVRGQTPHFDYVAGECARGLMNVQLETGVPIGFGVLTTENLAQAEERADPARGNKGYGAALAAAELAVLAPARTRAGFRR